jgi:hypothetical protein
MTTTTATVLMVQTVTTTTSVATPVTVAANSGGPDAVWMQSGYSVPVNPASNVASQLNEYSPTMMLALVALAVFALIRNGGKSQQPVQYINCRFNAADSASNPKFKPKFEFTGRTAPNGGSAPHRRWFKRKRRRPHYLHGQTTLPCFF